MTIDIRSGIDDAFKKFDANDSQRADAVLVLASECEMVGDDCILKATREPIESDASRKHLEELKPHLFPPKFERSLADRAFADASLMARAELSKASRRGRNGQTGRRPTA